MLLLIAAVATGCKPHGEEAKPGELETVEVKTVKVEPMEILRTQNLPGTVYPSDQAVIASKLMATVATVEVTIGESVKAGDLLISLDAGEVEAQVEQAKASLAQLQRNLEREQALLAQKATTAEAVRTLEDEIRLARARLWEARTMESYTRIRAPFDGVITSKEVKRGDLASPGVPLMIVEGTGNLETHVQVPDSLMPLPLGAEVEISSRQETTTAILTEWSPAADAASRTRLAKLSLDDETRLRSGQYVTVHWPSEKDTSLYVPLRAIREMGQMESVFVFHDGAVEMRIIKTGGTIGEKVQILGGLQPGESVVMDPPNGIKDGQPARKTT